VSTWTKLPPVQGSVACLVVGPDTVHAAGALSDLTMDRMLAVGFGSVTASCDDIGVYSERDVEDERFWSVQQVEDLAKADPDHDWRISFYAPLWEAEYQRQGDGVWVLVRKGLGFA